MQEKGDSGAVATALREAHEEIQLDPSLVEVVSVLPPLLAGISVTTTVTPVVCFLRSATDPEDIKLIPNDEVESVFWVPLSLFVESQHHDTIRCNWRGREFLHNSFEALERASGRTHLVWGLTAIICIAASAIALNTAPAFPFTVGFICEVQKDGSVVLRELALTSKHIEQNSITLKAKL